MQSSVHSSHVGQEVEVDNRWHPLYGRRVPHQYSEQRAGSTVVHVEAAPGVIIVLAEWMLDPAACASMGIGAPRVAVEALIELDPLLVERGFRRSSHSDFRITTEEQNEQFAEIASDNAGTGRSPAPAQHHVRFPQAAEHRRIGSRDSDRVLGQLLDASGGHRWRSVTMTNADLLPAGVLKRKTVVYVRQSTQAQVQTNLESKRRQYELVDEAQRHDSQAGVRAARGLALRGRS